MPGLRGEAPNKNQAHSQPHGFALQEDLAALAQRRPPAQHGAQLKGTASGGFLVCQKIPAPSPARAEGSLQHHVLGLAERSVRLTGTEGKQGQGGPCRHGEGHGTGAVLACRSCPRCVSAQCFAVRSLGWVEIPEEDLAPGKSSIAVNNCIQQLSNSKCQGQGSADNWGEGQDLVMILKKDTMSLVDPLDHSLIHCQPILNIRVWGVGCNNGRCWRQGQNTWARCGSARSGDFAFVASDKDTCVLKCHVFHCNVPAKGIAKALHKMCSKIVAERAVASSRLPHAITLEPISTNDLPLQVDILDAVRQSIQKYEALYIGSLPVPRAMGSGSQASLLPGMDVLNEAIEKLTRGPGRECWTPSLISVSDTAMRVHPAQVGPGREGGALGRCG
ncbi:Amyloid beta A4 precursor protein-binding family B member 3 [Aix galericulata]|nr:Amyloid beta A4 precursor protein-binding family B member 3 [Aix galericulata]